MTTLATLLLELSLTRVFSVVFYYHFAFLAISMALFGLGAGGVLSYVIAGGGNLYSTLGKLSAANGVVIVVSLAAVLGQREDLSGWRVPVLYFAVAAPFVLAGAIVSAAISETIERVDRVYFFDLLGAAGGCLALVPLLNQFGGPNTVVAAAVLFAAAASLWFNLGGSGRGRIFSVALGLALVALIVVNLKTTVLDVKFAKGQRLKQEVFTRWNSLSRIGVTEDKDKNRMIFIDADASTGIAKFDFANLSEKERRDLLYQGPGLPYSVRPGAKTLIIGPGGGWDVSRALAGGSKDVTGVEINPLIADRIMRQAHPEWSNRLYLRPDVRIFVEDGRSFVRRSEEKYQVLQATLVDTWASTAAGAFALSENNLYTTDAMYDYASHLTDDGIMAFTRWGLDPPRESLRMISLAIDALGKLGEGDAARHVIVAREGKVEGWGAQDTVIVSRKPFAQADLDRARAAIRESKMQVVYMPDERPANPFTELLQAPDPAAYQRTYRYDITPVTDDRPFFFYSVQPRDLMAFLTTDSRDSADFKINRAVPLLFGLVAVSLVATLVILLLPPVVLGTRLPREPGVARFLMYFLFVGAGYILIEVALIQKFVLFLGHPTYALTVVIFSMLVASGIGSFFSRWIATGRQWMMLLASVAGLVAVMAMAVTPLLNSLISLPLGAKFAVAVAAIFPAGFAMGMPFPAGLRRLEAWHHPSVRWAWSLNAASSVLGSVMAIVLAIYLGLTNTLLVGGALYFLAIVAARGKGAELGQWVKP